MVKSYVDYATDNITVYRFCEFNCIYCWAWRIPLFSSRISRGKYNPIEETMKYLRIKEKRTIVISFTSDPYPFKETVAKITRRVLEVLSKAKQHRILILTKNPVAAAIRDIDIMLSHGDMWLGTTITTLDDDVAEKIETHAPLPYMRISALKFAHRKDVKTWLSIEPIIPYVTLPEEIVEQTIDFIDWYVLGSFNYYNYSRIKLPKVNRYIPDKFTRRELATWYNLHIPKAIRLLKEYNKPFYIKKELKKYLGD